jgi:uncharacterized protein (TIGR03435 family)
MTRGGPGTSSPGQITYNNLTVRMLVAKAWDLKPYQLRGPDSLDGQRFDIVAKLPPDASLKDFQLMLQDLLKERIGLEVHHESKEMPVYNLVIAKGGLKMTDAEPPPAEPLPASSKLDMDKNGFMLLPPGEKKAVISGLFGAFEISARVQAMSDLVATLERYAERPVLDKTGLSGKYDYKLGFARDSVAPPPAGGVPARVAAGLPPLPAKEPAAPDAAPTVARDPAPTFLDAVVLQLGLKLEPSKAPIDVVVVDGFNKVPIGN